MVDQHSVPEVPPAKSQRGWQPLRRLGIRQKILWGYGLILGIAVGGTVLGLVMSDFYQNRAQELRDDAIEEVALSNQLQITLLHIAWHQMELLHTLETDPEHFAESIAYFQTELAEVEEVWSTFKTSYEDIATDESDKELQVFQEMAEQYERSIQPYLEQANRLVQIATDQSEQLNNTVRQQLTDWIDSPESRAIEGFLDLLEEFEEIANEELAEYETELALATTLRTQIITGSIVLSILLAILLAYFISRSITKPLLKTTDVARTVTENSNFELQVPITAQDEVGQLGDSLNKLIVKVKQLLDEQKAATEEQLIQAEKMASLGRMLAGVAHEISNPVNFIYGNLVSADNYIKDLFRLLDTYQAQVPNPPIAVQEEIDAIELDFVAEDLPKLLQSIKVGAERTRQIVLSLRDFSRVDESEVHPVDLPACLDSTLLILNNPIKQGVNIVRNYREVPKPEGYAGLLYQVFMNLLSNALDALGDVDPATKPADWQPTIEISLTQPDNTQVEIQIVDNGPGIAAEHVDQIFQAFYTTKPRGVGTGLGLAISHQIVVEKHGGELQCQTQIGAGTTFNIRLPLRLQPPPMTAIQPPSASVLSHSPSA